MKLISILSQMICVVKGRRKKNTLRFVRLLIFAFAINRSLYDVMTLFYVHIYVCIGNTLKRSTLLPLRSSLACCCICTNTFGDDDDGGNTSW